MHIALFATAALCVRSSHVRYYAVCGHLMCGIARHSSALCLKCGIIQYTGVAFYDLATQSVKSLYVGRYTIWQRSVLGYHTCGFIQYGNTVWLHGSTVCKVITCIALNHMAAQRVRSSNVRHFTI